MFVPANLPLGSLSQQYALKSPGANTDVLNVGSTASNSNITEGTLLVWANLTTLAPAAQRSFLGKEGGGNFLSIYLTGSNSRVRMEMSATTTAMTTVCATSTLPNLATGKPCFWVFTWSLTGTNTGNRIYTGDLNNIPLEATAYVTHTAGVGTHNTDAANNMFLMNFNPTSFNFSLPGTVWSMQLFRSQLAYTEIVERQFSYTPTGVTAGSWRFGANGNGLVLDESGNGNHGVPVGLTIAAENLPLPVQDNSEEMALRAVLQSQLKVA